MMLYLRISSDKLIGTNDTLRGVQTFCSLIFLPVNVLDIEEYQNSAWFGCCNKRISEPFLCLVSARRKQERGNVPAISHCFFIGGPMSADG